MTKKYFKECMKRGLGRCAIVLQSEKSIEKYKDTVFFGCLHNLSFDTQVEGTRAAYVYNLTTYFNDEDYFVLPTVKAFERISRRHDWLFLHFIELLACFAKNGNKTAELALRKKYDFLLSTLINKKSFRGYDFERDNFERLCLTLSLAYGASEALKIVSDMGELFLENSHYSCDDFDWFFSSLGDEIGGKEFNALLKGEAKKSRSVARFCEEYSGLKNSLMAEIKPLKSSDINANDIYNAIENGTFSQSLNVKFKRTEDEEKQILAQKIINEPDLDKKAKMLSFFTLRDQVCLIPHQTVIEYSCSSNENLREIALDVLVNCQSEAVREYAIDLLAKEKYRAQAIQILICNYTSADKKLLLDELEKIKVDYSDESNWHAIGYTIMNAYEKGVKLPCEVFLYLYNTTLCSYCREEALKILAKHRHLTPEIIEECRFDSNLDIVKYVNKYYPKI